MSDLLDKALDMKNLRGAWEEIRANKGMPGVDEVSLKAWARNWEDRLMKLISSVRANTYKPHKLRLRKIPKKSRREFRTLRVPTVTDRVFQRAILQILHPVFERRFLDCSFGYRPKRGLADAVQRIIVLRENDYRWVLDADIDEFFDHVDHDLLLGFLRHDLPDDSLMPLIKKWLKTCRLEPDLAVGIPLGSPLSPLWANVFLHRLDQAAAARDRPVVRYADDFIVFAESREDAQSVYREVEETLAALKLKYEPSKTRVASFEEGFEFLGIRFRGDSCFYTHMGKEIEVQGDDLNLLFKRTLPEYE
ncbi:MAG: hypothetical protein HZB19_22425 [Chloroflexi bacterium]|nr:hypothetical protein [Chloroflexota bacterium]